MARQRMVTRTVEVTVCEVMCVDVITAEVTIQTLEVSGKFTYAIEIEKALKKAYETDTFKCVKINNVTTKEILYGMLETDFIKMAQILPPRGTTTEVEDLEDIDVTTAVENELTSDEPQTKKSKRK